MIISEGASSSVDHLKLIIMALALVTQIAIVPLAVVIWYFVRRRFEDWDVRFKEFTENLQKQLTEVRGEYVPRELCNSFHENTVTKFSLLINEIKSQFASLSDEFRRQMHQISQGDIQRLYDQIAKLSEKVARLEVRAHTPENEEV